MKVSTVTDASLVHAAHIEWASLQAQRRNVLIEGPLAATRLVLRLLRPHVPEPVVWKRAHAPLKLGNDHTSALIVESVSTLSRDEQTQLLARLDDPRSHIQIVASTEQPLSALVGRGLFDANLYDRLNVVFLKVGSAH